MFARRLPRYVGVLVCCLVLACSKREKAAVSPCDTAPLAGLIKEHPIHVLCGAADIIPGAKAICDSTFEEPWKTFEPRHLYDRVDPEKVNAAILVLCDLLDDVPADRRTDMSAGIDSWVTTSFALERAEDVGLEYFASAVVRVPEVRSTVPEDVIARSPDQMAGFTMASAQFTDMNYELTHILSRMTPAERDRILGEIQAKSAELLKREE